MNLDFIIPKQMIAPGISGNELYCTDSFNHAMQCCNIWCSNPGCSYIKAIFYHHMAADMQKNESSLELSHDSCNTCQRFNIYASQHSANCRNMLCSLKFCKNNRPLSAISAPSLRGRRVASVRGRGFGTFNQFEPLFDLFNAPSNVAVPSDEQSNVPSDTPSNVAVPSDEQYNADAPSDAPSNVAVPSDSNLETNVAKKRRF